MFVRGSTSAERRRTALVLLASPVVGYVAVRLGTEALNASLPELAESLGGSSAADADPPLETATSRTLALWGGVVAFLVAAKFRFAPGPSPDAQIRAAERRRTSEILHDLPDIFTVLHDLRVPGGRYTIDHVIVGPTGVFTLETRHYPQGVVIRAGRAWTADRPLDNAVTRAMRQADEVAQQVGTVVTPIVCVHGKGVILEGWFERSTIDEVRFCSGHRLTREITDRPRRFATDDLERAASVLVLD